MTLAAFRARKRLLQEISVSPFPEASYRRGLEAAVMVLDEELERVAEQEFLRPMNPDPLTTFAKAQPKGSIK